MSEVYLCKLKPKSSFHIGTSEGIGMEATDNVVRSDTLYGALVSKYFKLFGEEENKVFAKHENPKPNFILSSAFPFHKNVLFLPRPYVKPNVKKLEEPKTAKKIKKIEFISEATFPRYIGGSNPLKVEDEMLIQQKFLLASDENLAELPDCIFQNQETTRNVLDRQTERSEVYHVGELVFSKGSGFYFFLRIFDQSILSKLKAALRLLGEDGLGGDRSSGKGQYEIEAFESYEGRLRELMDGNSDHFLTLSLYFPKEEEIKAGLLKGEKVAYSLVKRGGWIDGTSYRKRTLWMFEEGSVFKNIGQDICGAIKDVRPENFKYHPVLRNGIAFKLAI